jgi:hypothetical protein
MRQRVVPVVPQMEVPAVPMHSAAHSTVSAVTPLLFTKICSYCLPHKAQLSIRTLRTMYSPNQQAGSTTA